MDKYINQQTLQNALERKQCGPANKRYTEGWNDCLMRVKSMVSAAPIIDAVPVVRCKDCVHWDDDPDTYGADYGPKGKCMKSFETMRADDFCSYGERRDGGDGSTSMQGLPGSSGGLSQYGSLLQVGGISGGQSRGAEQPPIAAGKRRYEGLYHSPSDAVSA